MKEYAIGETLEVDGVKLECVETAGLSTCHGCFFMEYKHNDYNCDERACTPKDRSDGKNVKFIHAAQPEETVTVTSSSKLITSVCDSIKDMLLEKNRKYGDSALNPCRIFSRSDAMEQIKVRIDDKLSRIKSAQNDEDEDVITDLIGYLVLLKIAKNRKDK